MKSGQPTRRNSSSSHQTSECGLRATGQGFRNEKSAPSLTGEKVVGSSLASQAKCKLWALTGRGLSSGRHRWFRGQKRDSWEGITLRGQGPCCPILMRRHVYLCLRIASWLSPLCPADSRARAWPDLPIWVCWKQHFQVWFLVLTGPEEPAVSSSQEGVMPL